MSQVPMAYALQVRIEVKENKEMFGKIKMVWYKIY